MPMSSNSFCRHLSNGIRIYVNNNNITWAPCCYWTGSPFPFQQHDDIRKKINISTPWAHKECTKCKNEEQYKHGYRRAGLDIIPSDMPDTKIAWMDIQADTTCNGGCLICGPWSSSFWQSELARHNEFSIKKNPQLIDNIIKYTFKSVDTSELKLIQFLGGEPFLSNIDTLVLPLISAPENCTVKYTTNGSVYPRSQRIEQWKKFKSVLINFSIDGLNEKFEYLRYPLKWSTVEANIQNLINETDETIKFHINHTITPFNILYYNEFLEWVDRIFPKNRFDGIHTHPAYGIMSVAHSSQLLREIVAAKYGIDHKLSVMLQQNPSSGSTEFWKYIETWDQRRNINWKTVFPELVNVLDRA